MTPVQADVIVAGHICLDIIPEIRGSQAGLEALLVPGKLVDVGPAVISTGGAVSNTGIALHKLGSRVSLMGKIGNDPFGEAVLAVLRQISPILGEGMITLPNEHTSYSLVISPPHTDRMFLHSTGANDTYSSADLSAEQLSGARLFHFGYPPLMRRMYEQDGTELAMLLCKAKASGLTVSLDLAKPDPASEAGRADWRRILEGALPFVDVFLPSFEEILFMLDHGRFEQMTREAGDGDVLSRVDAALLSALAEELLDMGAAVVGLKLGEHGLYVRTSSVADRLAHMGPCSPSSSLLANWTGREVLAPCYSVEAAGTTGAGDCTIAGFLAGLLHGLSLEDTLRSAVGVGAFNVEKADATSGIPAWADVWSRISGGWAQRDMKLKADGWSEREGLWFGSYHQSDRKGRDIR